MVCLKCGQVFGIGRRQCVLPCSHAFCTACLAKQPRNCGTTRKCPQCGSEATEQPEAHAGAVHFMSREGTQHLVTTAGFALPRRLQKWNEDAECLKLPDELPVPVTTHVGLRALSNDAKFGVHFLAGNRNTIMKILVLFNDNLVVMTPYDLVMGLQQSQSSLKFKCGLQLDRCHRLTCVENEDYFLVRLDNRLLGRSKKIGHKEIASRCRKIHVTGKSFFGVELNFFYCSRICRGSTDFCSSS